MATDVIANNNTINNNTTNNKTAVNAVSVEKNFTDSQIDDSKQYLVLRMGKQEYGVDIKNIMSIIDKDMHITRVPKTVHYVKGVINLRGDIIPVINLRARLGLQEIEDTADTRIVIIKFDELVIGFIVDQISEVVRLKDERIEKVNDFSTIPMEYVIGAGKIGERIVTILSVERLIE